MCSLIVLRGLDRAYPLIVAANRDERTDRRASPPGIWHGERRRVMAPRDRVAGGTWIGVDDRGRFAGITNVYGEPPVDGAPSRGMLPLLALDSERLEDGVAAVQARVAEAPHSGFQLVLADAEHIVVLRNAGGRLQRTDWPTPVLAITNEHAAGEWLPRALEPALAPALGIEPRLEALRRIVCDRGGDGHHAVCKHGEVYGTVSSSLVAVPSDPRLPLVWAYAPGPPDITAFRSYGNLARRLRDPVA